MKLFCHAAQDLASQYEVLRQEATDAVSSGPRGHGLALFLARGMSAWVEALATLAPKTASPPSQDPSGQGHDRVPDLPLSVRADLRMVLAGMVLGCAQVRDIG